MKTKILISLIILVGLIVGGFFIWNIFVPEIEKEEAPTEIEIYKGIWLPTLLIQDPNHLASNIQKLKDVGVNTIFIQAFPPQPEQWLGKAKEVFPPELIKKIEEVIPIEKQFIIDNIQTAHRNGLKVALTVSNPPGLEGIDLEALNSKIIEYAKLAEEYDVELFAPMNEPGTILGENTGKWRQEILPRIKEVYHGEILWKGAGVGLPEKTLSEEFLKELSEAPPGDYQGYDYIGFSVMYIPSEGLTQEERLQFADRLTLEDYSQYVDNALKYVLALAERDNSKGVMISEFGVLEGGSLSEEEIARAHEIVLEKGKEKVVGFFALDFLGGELPGMPPIKEDLKTKEVIRKWFKEIL